MRRIEDTADAMRVARNSAFEGAIEVCQDLASRGGSARDCADAIRIMKATVDAEIARLMPSVIDASKGTH